MIIGGWRWSWLGVLRDDRFASKLGQNPWGVLPYISHIGMCPPPKGMEPVLGLFGLKTGTDFGHFGLE